MAKDIKELRQQLLDSVHDGYFIELKHTDAKAYAQLVKTVLGKDDLNDKDTIEAITTITRNIIKNG